MFIMYFENANMIYAHKPKAKFLPGIQYEVNATRSFKEMKSVHNQKQRHRNQIMQCLHVNIK